MNMGMLLMVCSAIAALCVVSLASNPVGIAAVALAGVVAAVYSVVTGFSIRDLVRSCKQVKQVKEEGLVTVQSLQPVLTPITPNISEVGKRVGYGITAAGTAAAAGAGGYFATQAAVGGGVLAGASAYASTVAAAIKAAVANVVGTGTAVGKAVGTAWGVGAGVVTASATVKTAGTAVGNAALIAGKTAAEAAVDAVAKIGVGASAATAGEAAAKAFGAATGAEAVAKAAGATSWVAVGGKVAVGAGSGADVAKAVAYGVSGEVAKEVGLGNGVQGLAAWTSAGVAKVGAEAGGITVEASGVYAGVGSVSAKGVVYAEGTVAVSGTVSAKASVLGGCGITAKAGFGAGTASAAAEGEVTGGGTWAAAVTITAGAAALAFIPYALMAFSILINVCTIIQTIADLYSAKVPVTDKCFSSVIDNYKDTKDYKGGPDLLNHDEIEDYKQEKKAGMRMLKWLTPPLAASPKYRLLMALACIAITICVALLLPLTAWTIAAIAPPLVSCLFYGYAAYACKRRGRKSVIPDTSPCIETTAEPLEQSPPSTPEQEVCADPTVTALVHNTQDWEPVPTCSSVEVVSGDLHSKGVGTTEEQGLKQNTDQGWEPVAKTDGSCTAKTAPEKVAKAAKTTEKVAKATFGGTGVGAATTYLLKQQLFRMGGGQDYTSFAFGYRACACAAATLDTEQLRAKVVVLPSGVSERLLGPVLSSTSKMFVFAIAGCANLASFLSVYTLAISRQRKTQARKACTPKRTLSCMLKSRCVLPRSKYASYTWHKKCANSNKAMVKNKPDCIRYQFFLFCDIDKAASEAQLPPLRAASNRSFLYATETS
ncbi:hypothetical protein [Anaplasma centrale]